MKYPKWLNPNDEYLNKIVSIGQNVNFTHWHTFELLRAFEELKYYINLEQKFEIICYLNFITNSKKIVGNNIYFKEIDENYVYRYRLSNGGKNPSWYMMHYHFYRAYPSICSSLKEFIDSELEKGSECGDRFRNKTQWVNKKIQNFNETKWNMLLVHIKESFIMHVLEIKHKNDIKDTLFKFQNERVDTKDFLVKDGSLTYETLNHIHEYWIKKGMK